MSLSPLTEAMKKLNNLGRSEKKNLTEPAHKTGYVKESISEDVKWSDLSDEEKLERKVDEFNRRYSHPDSGRYGSAGPYHIDYEKKDGKYILDDRVFDNADDARSYISNLDCGIQCSIWGAD